MFYIDSMYRGGANRVIANLVNYFAGRGFNVFLVNDSFGNKENEYAVNDKVQRIALVSENKKKQGFLLGTISRILRLRAVIKKEKPVTVVSFMGPPNYRMLLACLGIKTRKIVSVRNDPYREYGKGFKKLFANLLFRFANGVVFQTEEASLFFSRTIRKKSCIIFNPVNELFYTQNLHEEKNEIVFIGRLQNQKNPRMLLDSFNLIKDKYPMHRLLFYGEGELLSSLKEKVNEYGIENRVLFLGLTNNVPECLSSACCFVLCSDFEGMPNSLMEAMAVGVPVISTDCPCGGPRTLIQSEEQGLLVGIRDTRMLSEALDRILASKQLREMMRTASRERAKEFQPETVFQQWEKFLLNTETAI